MIIRTEVETRVINTQYDHVISSMDLRGIDTMGINLRVEITDSSLLTQELWADLLKLYRSLLWAKKNGMLQARNLESVIQYRQLRS